MSNTTSNRPESNFPYGAEWVRADFHLHTKADAQFSYSGDANSFVADYIGAVEESGIRIGVITNHNKFDLEEFKALRSAAKKRGIGLLAGVELSVNDGANGIHTLIVFSEQWLSNGEDHINPFLTVAFEGKIPARYEREDGRSSLSLMETIRKLEGYHKDFFLVFAHVEQKSGLWEELDGGRLEETGRNESFARHTLGFQKVRTHDGAGKDRPCRTKVQSWLGHLYPAEVEGSDPKTINEIGQGGHCYLKLGELSFEAVKFALFDHQHRVHQKLPEERKSVVIRMIRFEGGMLDGSIIPFSSSLNCFIGPRGNGKSAVIECMRHALGYKAESDEKYKVGLVDRMLSPAGKVVIEAIDADSRLIRVERERSGQSSVFVDGTYHDIRPGSVLKDILYFGQKDLSTRSEEFDESFLEKLLADRLDAQIQEESRLIEAVRRAALQLKETNEAAEKLTVLQKEKNELEVQLQVYVDKGVDKKLEEMTLFDSDRQVIQGWLEELARLGQTIKEATNWEHVERSYPELRSTRMHAIIEDLSRAKDASDEAKRTAISAITSLEDASMIVTAAINKLKPFQEELQTEVAVLQQSLNEPQLDLEVFRKKKTRLEQLKKLLETGAQRGRTEQLARDVLGAAVNKLNEFWRERFIERETEVRRLEEELPEEIRLQTTFKGKRAAFETFLRGVMKGSGLHSSVYETLRDTFSDGREIFQDRMDLEKHLTESGVTKVRAALLDNLAEFLTFRTPDTTEILYKHKPLGDYSLGQRATVILHILMHLRRHPVIIIDQPEDDLDNETLYSHFVLQLLHRKELTQFIFATHNANIPVLGDAEQAIVCRKDGDQFSFEQGSIDNKSIQDRIVTIMEGGEDAFLRRKEIYQLWKSSN